MKKIIVTLVLLAFLSTLLQIQQQIHLGPPQQQIEATPTCPSSPGLFFPKNALGPYVSSSAPGYQAAALTDRDRASAWSSIRNTSPSQSEWFAFYFDNIYSTRYIKLVPQVDPATNTLKGVPQSVSLYYAGAPGEWVFIKTVQLNNMPREGLVVLFDQAVNTNGIRVQSNGTLPDGGYFGMAEAYGGNPACPTKVITSNGITLKVYANKGAKVMDNADWNTLSYDFNVTELDSGSYVAIFHAEPYDYLTDCWGDTVAAKYASSADGYFGSRSRSAAGNPGAGDYIVTRPRSDALPGCTNPNSGDATYFRWRYDAANPLLIKRKTSDDFQWTLTWLAVSRGDDSNNGTVLRHYLMQAVLQDAKNLFTTQWAALVNDGVPPLSLGGDRWQIFQGPLIDQAYNPVPAREFSSGSQGYVQGAWGTSDPGRTQGLIGNISYDKGLSKVYFFYSDGEGPAATYQRTAFSTQDLNWWTTPTAPILNTPVTKIAYHTGVNRWMVVYGCNPTLDGWDMCIQFTAGSSVSGIKALNITPCKHMEDGVCTQFVPYGLGMNQAINYMVCGTPLGASRLPRVGTPPRCLAPNGSLKAEDIGWNGVMAQVGILKNPYGQIPGNNFRLYGEYPGLWSQDVYSLPLVAQP